MTLLEYVDLVASWKIGGIYTDESAANTQQKLINIINSASRSVLYNLYVQTKSIPQIAYQSFDVIPNWKDENCISFEAILPSAIANFPVPQINGWDALVLKCDDSMPLREVESLQKLRQYRNNAGLKPMRGKGWYFVDGVNIQGFLKAGIKASDMLGRAVMQEPNKIFNYNIEIDQYPFPDDLIGQMKRLLEQENARRWQLGSDQTSNSKVDTDVQLNPTNARG
jgi:hypothetical protein